MRHTNRQTATKTLTDIYRSIDKAQAVTITYLDEDGTESVRTIEPFDVRTTKSGRIQVRAMCRLRGEARSFYLHRIVSYTLHRMAFVLDRPEATTAAGAVIVVRSAAQVIARELGRDYLPRTAVTHSDTTLAA
ncbi:MULTISPECIES: WYL domain-containing protein [unclassified Streptomyces]|uniref:WYL domain-containing protein n=1 Tax=unclassified Streptomyces TaxID=2593676 RepID=UPI001314C489|nr:MULTISPECIES: WYL domain-containing protein [unclassified Streptomyces]MYR75145.1 WYL domain-containing protein [Streptomyces sp. SID4925]